MAKITAESREAFTQKSAKYKELIKGVFAKEKELNAELQKDKSKEAEIKLQLTEQMIYAVTLYMTINNLSVDMLGVKNEENLNEEETRKFLNNSNYLLHISKKFSIFAPSKQ